MFFPPQIVLIPLFKLFNAVHLLDSRAALVIVHVGFGILICTLMMSNFFRAIPNELRQSAMIDGCHEWRILFSIMLPLAKPSLTALVILQFTWIWNDFLWPLVLMKTEAKMTIQMGIMQLRGQYGLAWGNQAAACLLATIPTLLIFLFMQKYFIRGLTMGAVKAEYTTKNNALRLTHPQPPSLWKKEGEIGWMRIPLFSEKRGGEGVSCDLLSCT